MKLPQLTYRQKCVDGCRLIPRGWKCGTSWGVGGRHAVPVLTTLFLGARLTDKQLHKRLHTSNEHTRRIALSKCVTHFTVQIGGF